ncbi:hypothetical protein BDL97_08G018600 [Sphagnum fallax]|nr:hypothetical protein BDL97_08G018600 [Sphagnum fallax]
MSGRYQRSGDSQRRYRGIRMRRWGKWVSEVRDPSTRSRIWLGSFRTAEEAAHAYDAALVCIRGPNSQLNFPHHLPTIPSGITPGHYTTRQIQAAAAASAAASVGRPFSYSDFLSPHASDSDEEEEQLEDITYEPAAQPINRLAMSQASSNGHNWENSVDFVDDPYEREWVQNIIFPPSPKLDDSDDENDSSFVEPSLWSYRR